MKFSEFCSQLHDRLGHLHNIALISHTFPDGDALGSLEGMRELLINNYPHLVVSVVVPPEEPDNHISWILGDTVATLPSQTDLVILLDTSIFSRTALPSETFSPYDTLCIDHHVVSDQSISGYIDSEAGSNTLILTEMAQELHWTVSARAATALLLGIYTDTGGFMHSNSDARIFQAASYLVARGAEQSRITTEVFGNYALSYLHDLGRGLLSIVVDHRVACLFLSDTDRGLKNHIVGFLSSLLDVDIACVLIQKRNDRALDSIVDQKPEVKCSIRTKSPTIDVNEIAQRFGGGGHKKAAGFELKDAVLRDGKLIWNDSEYSEQEFMKLLKII